MKKALSIMLSLVLMVCFSLSAGSDAKKISNKAPDTNVQLREEIAPINRDAVIDKLISEKKLSKNSTQDQITAALKKYIGSGTPSGKVTKYSKMKSAVNESKIEQGLKNASSGKGVKLGQGTKNVLDKAAAVDYGEPVKTVKVLVLLAQFPDLAHNNIEKPDLTRQYWTKDFNADHYQQLLFGDGFYTTPEGTKSPTFKEYFKEQSNGNLDIEGNVFGWYTVSRPAKYYGEDSGTSHNIHAQDFVKEAAELAAANGVDLKQYDQEDPYNLDGDDITDEPDGIVDHLMVIYAGMGQEEYGGILGDDAIWSHSSSVGLDPYVIRNSGGMSILDYTVEPEDGAVGVFAHEFTHDLGILDDYDTIYSADGDIVEYWSIMASGSWSGRPAGTMPTGENPYSRILLGLTYGGDWINWRYSQLSNLKSGFLTLDTATMNTGNTGNPQALLISLPAENNKLVMNKPASGLKEFYGGTGSQIDHSITVQLDLTGKTSASLSYDIWYDIEENWDGGFVQVSEGGSTWTSLKTLRMTDDFKNPEGYPSIINSLPGYTGSSNGWLQENIDLSSYAGKNIFLRFRYATDWASELYGMFVDNVVVTADGANILSENAESSFGAFTSDGWELSDGIRSGNHYYVAEWRSHLGVDEGLLHNAKANVAYNQGMLLWYVNYLYNDNWVGVHPGHGQLGVVDSTQYVYLNAGLGNGNESSLRAGYMPFVQLHDAAFSNSKAADMNLSIYTWAKNPNLTAKQAEPLFDDSKSYFSIKSPFSGLILPKLGLKIRVTGQASDYSRGQIYISR